MELSLDLKKTADTLEKFIRHSLDVSGFKKVIVGVSGGLDSAVTCALAVRAIGAQNVMTGIFPSGYLTIEALQDAQFLLEQLGLPSENRITVDIASIVDSFSNLDPDINDIRKGNIMARVRMILLFDNAKKHDCLVLGTENKTEHLLGYFTRFGDGASDIEPIRSLYKTQVRLLAHYLKLPPKLITKAPTAGLWQGQTDEGEFGFSYHDADLILHFYVDQGKTEKEIVKSGFSPQTVSLVVSRLKANAFKHKLPFVIDKSLV